MLCSIWSQSGRYRRRWLGAAAVPRPVETEAAFCRVLIPDGTRPSQEIEQAVEIVAHESDRSRRIDCLNLPFLQANHGNLALS